MLNLKWFRRKSDDKSLAGNAEQEISTINKLKMVDDAMGKLNNLFTERRFRAMHVEIERRRT